MRGAFFGHLERETAEAQRHRTVEQDVRLHEVGIVIRRIDRIVRSLARGEFFELLAGKSDGLAARRDHHRPILAEMPGAGRMIAGGMRDDVVADFLVGRAPDRGEHLIGGADVAVPDDDAFVGHDEHRIARPRRVLHDVDIVRDLAQFHARGLSRSEFTIARKRRESDDPKHCHG